MTSQDVLLVIVEGAEGRPYPVDPIRLMKGAFLVHKLGRPEWRELFDFAPYDYGPFDPSVYRARDALLSSGYLSARSDRRYDEYELTDTGRARLEEIESEIGEEDRNWLRSVGRYVASKSFSQLLREIYAEYPDYATRSVFVRS